MAVCKGCAMQDDEPLGDGTIHWLASIVADGTATPEEARRLLNEFVRQADAGRVTPRMTEHLRDCLAAFLDGKKTLLPSRDAGRDKPIGVPITTMEKAFGLTRIGSGRPPIDRDTLCAVAMEVLQRLLLGESLEKASAEVAEDRQSNRLPVSSDTQVSDAWAAHKVDAVVWLRISRRVGDDSRWTDTELARLRQIYADVPGVVLPGEKPFEGRHALD